MNTPSSNKSDTVFSKNKKIHQFISSSGSNDDDSNRRSSSTIARIENIGSRKSKRVSVEGESVEGDDNVVQAETSTIDDDNNTNLISLTRVEGDEAAKTTLETFGSTKDDGLMKVDFDISNKVQGDEKSSFSLIGEDEIHSNLFMERPEIRPIADNSKHFFS